jgi:hypothetical protein
MKHFWMIAAATIALALGVNPAGTVAADEKQNSKLAFELAALREAWLYGDDATAATRLDILRKDDRLSGDFPRWFGSMRAVLALENGDTKTALDAVQPVLEQSNDARNYLRAARLFLAYGAPQAALKVIRDGRARAPDSRALMRFEAGLQWLEGDYDGALETYMLLVMSDDRPQYPYVAAVYTRWSQARPWDATDDKPVQPAAAPDEDDWGWEEEPEVSGEYQPEPFADLFMPIYWYQSDLPGLDRCLDALRDAEQVKNRTSGLDDKIKQAVAAQEKVDTLRTGDNETRKQLEQEARRTRWHAVFTARLAALAKLNASEFEACEKITTGAIAIAPEDVALLDLQANALGKLGRAEEARSGPLARLRSLAWLTIYSSTLYNRGPGRQMVDRVFDPALTLYRANPDAGLSQFELMRNTFGDANRSQPVSAGTLGLWLYLNGEPELARKHLLEASRLSGYESGRPLYQDAIFVEMALIALGESAIEAAPAEGEKEDEKEIEQPKEEEEVDPLEIAKLDANTHPLLRKSLRAGAVLGSIPDARTLLRQLAEIDLWIGSAGISPVQTAAAFMPDGDKVLQETLWGLPGKIAAGVPDAELDRFLAPEHTTSQNLKSALEGLAELIGQSRTNQSWEIRQSLAQKTGPVLGLIEARAMLLRAKLIKDKPAKLADLTAWLVKYQPQIDLRASLQTRPGEDAARFNDARAKAGIPEVFHTGLLVDAARLLARAGSPGVAANLLWSNRDAVLGLESHNHLLALAAVLARKGGDPALALRCRLEAAQRAPDPRSNEMINPQELLVELPTVRADLLEFGETADLLLYIENQLIPNADTPDMTTIERIVPEMLQARPTLVMRNTSRNGTSGIFSESMSGGSCYVIVRNWYKMMASSDTLLNCRRFAAWVIASDLPVTGGANHNGLSATQDAIAGWLMLRELYRKQGPGNAKAAASLERLDKLISSTHTVIDEQEYYESEWWD